MCSPAILLKIKQYCVYQERCHAEVKEKLYSYELKKKEVEEIISVLIEENYLNEERFAIHFAGGKFRMKKWGRKKIIYELKSRQVSEYCIRKAIKEIPDEDYYETLRGLAEKKWEEMKKEKNRFSRMQKTYNFLTGKGFESSLVQEVLKEVSEKA